VHVSIIKSASSSLLQIGAGGQGAQFTIGFEANGPANAIGTFKVVADGVITVYTETFSGGQAYAADSGTVNITNSSSSNVTGTFQLWLHGGKIITGTVNANKPEIY
jgi:hypothetical protein